VISGSREAVEGGRALVLEDGRIGNGLSNEDDVVTLRDPSGRVIDEVDYSDPPLPRPEAGRSIVLTEGGWVLNTEPSPGDDDVTPLLARLEAAPAEGDADTADVEEGDGGRIPAWALVAVVVPLVALAGRELWRRRPPQPV
jgi:hypothetical protein